MGVLINVGDKSLEFKSLTFKSSSLVKELPVVKQNTELKWKMRQNGAHQNTAGAVRGDSDLGSTPWTCLNHCF